jgi:predicted nucleotidyltransferase
VLHRLVVHGLVLHERHGNTTSYVLNRDHLLAGPVEEMAEATAALEDEIRDVVEGWQLPPSAIVVFGSFARRDGDESSDLDLLLVRPPDVEADEPRWTAQRESLVQTVELRSGNRVQIVELSTSELDEAVRRDEPLVGALRRDAVVLTGTVPALARRPAPFTPSDAASQ